MMSYQILKGLVAPLIAALVALSGGARAAAADRITVTIEGAKQGVFKGDRTGKISATAFGLESKSPTDAASGRASGKVHNLPVTITKEIDAASPQIFQALCTNEPLKSVTIELYATGPDGKETAVQVVRLTNASVAGLRQSLDPGAGASAGPREEVSFAYQSIDFGPAAPVAEAPAEAKPAEAAPAEPKPAPARQPGLRQPVERPVSPTRVPRTP
jgi:type VI secretion system secreted protein Hcp